ncbi:MAG TPA: hypothetical protein VGJ08_17035, partial [Rhizomicrobium sp.]
MVLDRPKVVANPFLGKQRANARTAGIVDNDGVQRSCQQTFVAQPPCRVMRGAAQNVDRRARRGVSFEQVDVRTIATFSGSKKNVERQGVRHPVQQMLLRPICDALCESSPALLL